MLSLPYSQDYKYPNLYTNEAALWCAGVKCASYPCTCSEKHNDRTIDFLLVSQSRNQMLGVSLYSITHARNSKSPPKVLDS